MSTNIGLGKQYILTTAYWPDTTGYMLTDGSVVWSTWKVGWYQSTYYVEMDLGDKYNVESWRFNYVVWGPAGMPAPTCMTVMTASATSNFTSYGIWYGTSCWASTDLLNVGQWSTYLLTSNTSAIRYIRWSNPSPGSGKGNCIQEIEVFGTTEVPVIPETTTSINYLKDRPRNRLAFDGVSAG